MIIFDLAHFFRILVPILYRKSRNSLTFRLKTNSCTIPHELISVRDTIMEKKDYVLNYFNNRSTNASAESFNSKIKGFRVQVRGVRHVILLVPYGQDIWLGEVVYPRTISPEP